MARQPRADSHAGVLWSHPRMIWPLPTFRALVLTVQPFNPLHPCTSQTCHIPDHRPFAQSVLSAWTVLPILFDIQQTYMLRVYILRNLQHPQELGVNMITPILQRGGWSRERANPALSSSASPQHTWLSSTWNAADLNQLCSMSVKYTMEFKDLECKKGICKTSH